MNYFYYLCTRKTNVVLSHANRYHDLHGAFAR